MKNAIKKNIVLVMFFTILSSYATEVSTLRNNEDGKTTLMLTEVKRGDQLIIKDTYGVILFKEAIQKNGNYTKSFDLTNLPDGNYNFELDGEFQIKIIPFKVILNTVTFNKKAENIIHKPFVRVKNHSLYITKLALKKEPLSIKLYYHNELIHAETIKNTQTIERVYRLLKNKKGEYKLVFSTVGRTFEKRIKI